jgi:hypothetical protein
VEKVEELGMQTMFRVIAPVNIAKKFEDRNENKL